MKPLSAAEQDRLTELNKNKLCDRCHEKERYRYLDWCSDCLYEFAIGESGESELTQLRSQVSGLRMFHKWATTEIELQAKTILRLALLEDTSDIDAQRLLDNSRKSLLTSSPNICSIEL